MSCGGFGVGFEVRLNTPVGVGKVTTVNKPAFPVDEVCESVKPSCVWCRAKLPRTELFPLFHGSQAKPANGARSLRLRS